MRKIFFICGLLVPILGASVSARADPEASGPTPGHPIPVTLVTPTQKRSIEDLMQFFAQNGMLAGIASVCNPTVAEILHECTSLQVANWNRASGEPPIDDLAAASKLGQSIWTSMFKEAKEKQSLFTPPMTCDQAMPLVMKAPALHVCAPVPGSKLDQSGGGSDPQPGDSAPDSGDQQPPVNPGPGTGDTNSVVGQPVQLQ
jgi:hypothetical protein